MRVFVAINPADDERGRLFEASKRLRERPLPVRWVAPDRVHLTLKFLGELSDGRVTEVSAAVDHIVASFRPFRIAVHGFGAFPSLRRPQVLWVGVEPAPTLQAVQAAIDRALEELGFEREGRSFHPHLTLGRTKRGASSRDFRGLEELVQRMEYSDNFEVKAIDVMRSQLTPAGAVYDLMHSARLG